MDQITKSELFTNAYVGITSQFNEMMLRNYLNLKFSNYVVEKYKKVPKCENIKDKYPDFSNFFKPHLYF